ncbi:MAG TPA: AbrB/MazE/SpoVT family DNA-binding domain-containing protein [Burkholderiales bacterium]|nr:AbrB/MazE/SpoVT family DNA-binding domain-containing protein [Burkholderiales bacterium]
MKVAKWGNSLAVRLPAAVVAVLDLREGDDIGIIVVGARVFKVTKSPSRRQIAARLRKFGGRLPPDFEFERFEANERSK